MDSRIMFMLLFILVIGYTQAETRSFETFDVMDMPIDSKIPSESEFPKAIARSERLCTLCEEFTAQAEHYLGENKTQFEIITALHIACARLHSLKQQCILLVDYYAPLFFVEIATVSPDQFCEKVNLCEGMVLARLPKRDDACTLCRHVVLEVRSKLDDPDTQLEIIDILLKGCNKVENFVQECKKLVFEYGPLILANTEKFLEAKDICAAIHACKSGLETASLLSAAA